MCHTQFNLANEHANKLTCAKHAPVSGQTITTRGRGIGGHATHRGGGGRGQSAGRVRTRGAGGAVAQRGKLDRVAALKNEPKLNAGHMDLEVDDGDFNVEADFNEDVFDHDSPQHDSEAEGSDESEHEPDDISDAASDLDEGYDGYVEEHAEHDNSAGAVDEEVAPPPLMRCFQQ